jgi:hypothetical protein
MMDFRVMKNANHDLIPPSVPCRTLLTLLIVLISMGSALGASLEGKETGREKEDEKLLQEVELPPDPSRSSEEQTSEQYFQRFVIRTSQGQRIIGAYWYHQGNPSEIAIDIFALDTTPSKTLARRIFTGDLGAGVSALEVIDFDLDGRDDLLFITNTGGMIAKTGVIALRHTPLGFAEVFNYIGTDVWVYQEHGKMRIMVKAKSAKIAEEYSWNSAKQRFVRTRTVSLIY